VAYKNITAAYIYYRNTLPIKSDFSQRYHHHQVKTVIKKAPDNI